MYTDAWTEELRALLAPERVSVEEADLAAHSYDWWPVAEVTLKIFPMVPAQVFKTLSFPTLSAGLTAMRGA